MHVILLKAQNQPMLPCDMKFVHAAALLAVLLQVSGRADALYEKGGPVAVLGGSARSFAAVTRSKVPVVVVRRQTDH
jgi:accessory colonization factor AcfC